MADEQERTDDLKERLRSDDIQDAAEVAPEAADCIEELETSKLNWMSWQAQAVQRAETAEAKCERLKSALLTARHAAEGRAQQIKDQTALAIDQPQQGESETPRWPCEVTRVHGTQYVIASNLQGGPALYWENADVTEWTWLRHLDLDFTADQPQQGGSEAPDCTKLLAGWIAEMFCDDDGPADIDGEDLEAAMKECGFVRSERYDPDKHGSFDFGLEPGQDGILTLEPKAAQARKLYRTFAAAKAKRNTTP